MNIPTHIVAKPIQTAAVAVSGLRFSDTEFMTLCVAMPDLSQAKHSRRERDMKILDRRMTGRDPRPVLGSAGQACRRARYIILRNATALQSTIGIRMHHASRIDQDFVTAAGVGAARCSFF